MARDLIPPQSPAGRPGSSAEAERERARELEEQRGKQKGGLWARTSEAEATELDTAGAMVAADPDAASEEAHDSASTPVRESTPYRSRFGLVFGALLGLAIATLAVGAAVYVATGGGNGAPDGWSKWKPDSDDGVGAAKEIATHVEDQYRLTNGDQIVGVQAGPLEVFDVPLEVALKTAPQGGDIDFIDGNGLMYTLNGLGPKGSIRGGKPSDERGLLVRREALELALYTFRYIDDVDLVVALLPPAPEPEPAPAKTGAAAAAATPKVEKPPPTLALFYRPGDLEPQLEIPLSATIPPKTPRPETLADSEARRIDALTHANVFEYSFQQGQDQKAFLVLDRLPG